MLRRAFHVYPQGKQKMSQFFGAFRDAGALQGMHKLFIDLIWLVLPRMVDPTNTQPRHRARYSFFGAFRELIVKQREGGLSRFS